MNIKISMHESIKKIEPLDPIRSRRKSPAEKATGQELTKYLGLTGSLNFPGHGALPVAAFCASHLQQLVGDLAVGDLKEANTVLNEVRALKPRTQLRSQISRFLRRRAREGIIYFQNPDPKLPLLHHITG